MKLKQVVLILFLADYIGQLYFVFRYFHVRLNNLFDVAELLREMLLIAGLVCILIGLYQCVRDRTLELKDIFRFPLLFSIVDSWMNVLMIIFGKKFSFSDYAHPGLVLLNYAFILVTMYCFLSERKSTPKSGESIPVNQSGRLLNFLIDSFMIIILATWNLMLLSYTPDGSVVSDITIRVFYSCCALSYYFGLEVVFGQTIGKLTNRSYVQTSGNWYSNILLRSLARFIPLDAISFLLKEGKWHDRISGTTVVKYKSHTSD